MGALLLLVMSAVLGGEAPIGPGDPDPGVTLDLARERAARVSDLRYELSLSIPSERTAPINGEVTLRFVLADRARPLVLDFAVPASDVSRIAIDGRPVDARLVNGHIVLPSTALTAGEIGVTVAFRAGDAPLNIFVPARAHQRSPASTSRT